jgi:hypothetical protein
MNEYRGNRWLVITLGVVTAAIIGAIAYSLGVSQGLAQAGTAAGNVPPYAYGWHRPWGFGFFPVLMLFFWFVVLKHLLWRRWGGPWGGPWGPWSHYGPPPPFRDRFDEWHRQAHERMGKDS